MRPIAFIFYFLYLIIYGSLVWAVIWQIKRYLLPNDGSKWVLRIFVIGSIAIAIVSLILFLYGIKSAFFQTIGCWNFRLFFYKFHTSYFV